MSMDKRNYVAERPDKTFEVVIEGKLRIVLPDQEQAERFYNTQKDLSNEVTA